MRTVKDRLNRSCAQRILRMMVLGSLVGASLTGEADEPKLPKVVLVGDSIRDGYAPMVAKKLAGQAAVVSVSEFGRNSSDLLNGLDKVFREQPDLVHFNCGLHDLAKSNDSGMYEVPIDQYESNLKQIVQRLKNDTKARLIFATTTPIVDERHAGRKAAFSRCEADVLRYNEAALSVMRAVGVPIDDLHEAVAAAGGEKLIGPDGTHYDQAGYAKLGEIVASCIRTSLSSPDYRLELTTVASGFDGKQTWVHARAGAIPASAFSLATESPAVVMTLQKLRVDRSDVFSGLLEFRSFNLGKTWKGPLPQPTLNRQAPREGVEVVPCDFWPKWHMRSGKLLGTGATFWYDTTRDDHLPNAPSETAYATLDPATWSWNEWKTLDMPKDPKFRFSRAGCTQRYDLPNGEILLPLYFLLPGTKHLVSTICRCSFDGETLSYLEHGSEMTIPSDRGLAEPSLTRFHDRYFLTLRHDLRGYVTSSRDGLNFDTVRPWKFDDGSDLGSYNTQTHWVIHSDGLFLVYTRRGAGNDHVFRHRAPLFMAQVDPEKLVVIRSTERILVPEHGAGLGNFGVTEVSPDETWIITTEWMQPNTAPRYGSDNRVFVAKIHWNSPNLLVSAKRF